MKWASKNEADTSAQALGRRINRPIALVGLMGAGKSTVGRRLAATLHMPFIDADDEIERAAAMPIADIFQNFGEDYFRDGERRVIARLLSGPPVVLATGGGAFANDATRSLLLEQSVPIWLRANLDTLVERVSRRSHRPLLIGRDARTVLEQLSAVRDPFYSQAPIHVESNAGSRERTMQAILRALEGAFPA